MSEALPTTVESTPADLSAVKRRSAATLRSKMHCLTLLGVAGGIGLGGAAIQQDQTVWPLLGAMLLLLCLLGAAVQWICRPLERLIEQTEQVTHTHRPDVIRRLASQRGDEVGRLARAIETLALGSLRNHHEAARLRRTLDDSVTRATHHATLQLRQMVQQDPLTHLGNRRFLDEQLGPMFDQAKRDGIALTVMVIDVDGFKQANDQLGHAVGDELLVLLAGLLRAASRPGDPVVRLGGDEFAMLMPGVTLENAARRAELLCKLYAQQAQARYPKCPKTSLSIGFASTDDDDVSSSADLLALADQRMYATKHLDISSNVSSDQASVC